jgi:hypothetical protein
MPIDLTCDLFGIYDVGLRFSKAKIKLPFYLASFEGIQFVVVEYDGKRLSVSHNWLILFTRRY